MITDLYKFSESEFTLFVMVLLRTSGFIVAWPILSSEQVSAQVKILFALILAILIFPTLNFGAAQAEVATANLIVLSIKEVFVGLCTGYLAKFFFFGFQIAGEMVSTSMGLNSAQVFNPALGTNSTAVEHFYVTLASLFFLAAGGHHYLLTGMVDSFQWLPVGTLSLHTDQFLGVGVMIQEIVEIGLKMSAPVVIAILVTNLLMGVIGKTVPQLNVLVTSFPVNIFIGLALLFATMPLFVDHMGDFLETSSLRVFQFVKTF